MLQHGADIHTYVSPHTALELAAEFNNKDVVNYLLYEDACKPVEIDSINTNNEIKDILYSSKRSTIPSVAREILIEDAAQGKNIMKRLHNRQIGKK